MKTQREHCSAIKYFIVFLYCTFSFAGHKINYVLKYKEAILVVLFLYSSNRLPESGSSTPGDQERIIFSYHVEQRDHLPTYPSCG